MQRELVDSTCIYAVGYDIGLEALEIEMHGNGSSVGNGNVYVYYNVPKGIVIDFLQAESLGGFYNEKIKGVFASSKMSDS